MDADESALWLWNAALSLAFLLSVLGNLSQWSRARRKRKDMRRHIGGVGALADSMDRVNERS